MERKFAQFPHPPIHRSALLSKPATERLPTVEEISAIENELKTVQMRTIERVTLADANLAALERLAKKMKEKDKLKLKIVPKVRRESTGTFAVQLARSLLMSARVHHYFIPDDRELLVADKQYLTLLCGRSPAL